MIFILSLWVKNDTANKIALKFKSSTTNTITIALDTISSDKRIIALDLYLKEKANQGQWFTILYSKSDTILYAKGFGYAQLGQIKNSRKTIYDIGSLTKIFTAVGIIQLQEAGQLSFSDKLSQFFPNISKDKSSITIHQLLTHSSGLETYHDKKGDFENMSREKVFKRINKESILFEPGTAFNYSNTGYTLLAYIIEDISKMSFQDYCYKNIFEPLKMNHTSFHGDFEMESKIVFGYGDKFYKNNNPAKWPSPSGAIYGNGGILSSAEDLLKFSNSIKSKLISPSSWKQMTTEFIVNHRYNDIYLNDVCQGYAWNIYNNPVIGKTAFMGGSNNYGFISRLRYYEDQNSTLIIITNNYKSSTKKAIISESVIQEIENILFQ
ncbi:serine hydrolase [Winogradskyella haliclonae]|uniref:Serine hydrolase n=1 Tax=Winogradskyella haliclonae TaxID=2048558 RepID=A0ABQ2C1F6_9FLAO|nr:serine hydrolase [Winogradskyella haliclonae]